MSRNKWLYTFNVCSSSQSSIKYEAPNTSSHARITFFLLRFVAFGFFFSIDSARDNVVLVYKDAKKGLEGSIRICFSPSEGTKLFRPEWVPNVVDGGGGRRRRRRRQRWRLQSNFSFSLPNKWGQPNLDPLLNVWKENSLFSRATNTNIAPKKGDSWEFWGLDFGMEKRQSTQRWNENKKELTKSIF